MREGLLCKQAGITINIFLLSSWSQSSEDIRFAYKLAESTTGRVFFTAGACGPCRFGMYVTEYRKALRDSGFDGFRVLLFQQQGGIKQATGDELGLADEVLHRQQLDRSDAEAAQVLDDRRGGEAGEATSVRLGDARVAGGEVTDVRLVDDAAVVRRLRGAVAGPVEERVDHHAGHGVAE